MSLTGAMSDHLDLLSQPKIMSNFVVRWHHHGTGNKNMILLYIETWLLWRYLQDVSLHNWEICSIRKVDRDGC